MNASKSNLVHWFSRIAFWPVAVLSLALTFYIYEVHYVSFGGSLYSAVLAARLFLLVSFLALLCLWIFKPQVQIAVVLAIFFLFTPGIVELFYLLIFDPEIEPFNTRQFTVYFFRDAIIVVVIIGLVTKLRHFVRGNNLVEDASHERQNDRDSN